MDTSLKVSESGLSGSLDLNLGVHKPGDEAFMPFTLIIFGEEAMQKWQEAPDELRFVTLTDLLLKVTMLNLAGLSDEEAVAYYNTTAAAQGIDNHALMYTPAE